MYRRRAHTIVLFVMPASIGLYSTWYHFQRSHQRPHPSNQTLSNQWNQLTRDGQKKIVAAIRKVKAHTQDVAKARSARDRELRIADATVKARRLRQHRRVRDRRRKLVEVWAVYHNAIQLNGLAIPLFARKAHKKVLLKFRKDEANCNAIQDWFPWPRIPGIRRQLREDQDLLLDTADDGLARPEERPFWGGSWLLGSGGQGKVGILAKQDRYCRIADRVVVKLEIIYHDTWDMPHRWWVDSQNNKVPIEYGALRVLHGTPCVLNARSCQIDGPHLDDEGLQSGFVKIITDYCNQGDLEALVTRFRNDALSRSEQAHYQKIPEPFLWHLFESLVAAIDSMHDTDTSSAQGLRKRQIVHRDLKLLNIFLDVPHQTRFAAYPSVKVGDFGLAIITHKKDGLNPHRYVGAGSVGWKAPEQYIMVPNTFIYGDDDLVGGPFQLHSHTNVWGVGKIMFHVMDHNLNFVDNSWAGDDEGHSVGFRFAGKRYTRRLRNLVLRCLDRSPPHRPHVRRLKKIITKCINELDVAAPMRDWNEGQQIRPEDWVGIRPDVFVVGKSFTDRRAPSYDFLIPSPEVPSDSNDDYNPDDDDVASENDGESDNDPKDDVPYLAGRVNNAETRDWNVSAADDVSVSSSDTGSEVRKDDESSEDEDPPVQDEGGGLVVPDEDDEEDNQDDSENEDEDDDDDDEDDDDDDEDDDDEEDQNNRQNEDDQENGDEGGNMNGDQVQGAPGQTTLRNIFDYMNSMDS